MSQSARVTSIEALKAFRESLCAFRVQAKEALCATELEIRRVFEWLNHQLKDWQRMVRQCQEEVLRAKNELVQRKYSKADGRGYTDQELALERAQKRLHEAEDKVERTRHWIRVLPRAVTEYEGPSRQLAGMLDAELAQGIVFLEQKIATLEAYVLLLAPSVQVDGGSSAPTPSPRAATPSRPPATPENQSELPQTMDQAGG